MLDLFFKCEKSFTIETKLKKFLIVLSTFLNRSTVAQMAERTTRIVDREVRGSNPRSGSYETAIN